MPSKGRGKGSGRRPAGRPLPTRIAKLDDTTFLGILRSRAPELGIGDLTLARNGVHARTYTDGRWVIRIAKCGDVHSSMRREAEWLPVLRPRLPLGIPDQFIMQEGDMLAAVHRRIAGSELDPAQLSGISKTRRRATVEPIARFICALHETDRSALPEVDGRDRRAERAVPSLVSHASEYLQDYLGLTLAHQLRCRLREYAAGAARWAHRQCVVHGSLAEHILVDADSLTPTGVVGFTHLSVGDPAIDFLGFYRECQPQVFGELITACGLSNDHQLLDRVRFHDMRDAAERAVQALVRRKPAEVEPHLARVYGALLEDRRVGSEGR